MIKVLKNSKKNKKYLIINYKRLNYPKGSKLVFIDEYLFNFYNSEDKSEFRCSYIYSIEDILKLNNDINNIIKKKLRIYRKQFKKKLNSYHNKNNSEKFWGRIIDYFLILILKKIILKTKLLKKIKIKDFNVTLTQEKIKFIFNTGNFITYVDSDSFNKLLNFIILKGTDNNFYNLRYINIHKQINENSDRLYIFILRYIIRLYIFIIKPIVLVNGYIGFNNSIKIFFKSFGKIINLPSLFIIKKNHKNILVDKIFRKKIKIIEKDEVDKIFNKIIGPLMPLNFIENFNFIKNDVKRISNKIKIIGTANCHENNDQFNILSSEIIKKNGKLLIFQHGGVISKSKDLRSGYLDKKYAFRRYYFDNPKGLGMGFFNQKKLTFDEIRGRNFILILNTYVSFEGISNYSSKDLNLHSSVIFFSKLKTQNKEKVLLKLFPEENSYRVKKFWKYKFDNQINFLPIYSKPKKEKFYNAKLVVLDDISSALWEVLFMKIPFILICSPTHLKEMQLINSFEKKFIELEKINVFFYDPIKAAEFVNALYQNYAIESWWSKVSNMKVFLDFKKDMFIEKPNYVSRLVKELKSLT